ncbi:hypothetical protein ACU8OR_30105 (plasmid) [Rhizobium leguminosarum]|uniref:hypothetical protein n=1 Tax=Rhizobium leguminosarum TaxID=384 RepID=UPI000DE54B02|nr:hypothetical protein [Rhizobium leguminosarum]MBB4526785.1 hypothetical protein [Rhizobium leguminosarum]MDH6663883.1 hypothetical protein [Rhizobium sophorae]
MANEQRIVEVLATDCDVKEPLGIVSVKQALGIRESELIAYSHPQHEVLNTDVFVTRDELAKLP